MMERRGSSRAGPLGNGTAEPGMAEQRSGIPTHGVARYRQCRAPPGKAPRRTAPHRKGNGEAPQGTVSWSGVMLFAKCLPNSGSADPGLGQTRR